jgi:hypothetical protein
MSDYLARLAGRVRHASSALHPLLPSFFESTITRVSTRPGIEQTGVEHSPVAVQETGTIVPKSDGSQRNSIGESRSDVSNDREEKRQVEKPAWTHASPEIRQEATGQQRMALRIPATVELSGSTTSPYAAPPQQIYRPWPQGRRTSVSPRSVYPASETRDATSLSPPIAHPELEIARPDFPPGQLPLSETANPVARSEPIRPFPFIEQEHSSLKLRPLIDFRETAYPQIQSPLGPEPASPAFPASITRSLGERQTKLTSPLPAAPEIHVTIGRIEVRAVSSSASIQRERPSRKPELSLDDYLRLRNQGSA